MNTTFRSDLQTGKIAENAVMRLYNRCGLKTTPVNVFSGDRDYWDLESVAPKLWMLPKNLLTTEVKYDVYAKKSRNLAIEVGNTTYQETRPSGITKTKATLWAHIIDDTIWLCRSNDLRDFVKYVTPKREIKNAGDGNAHIYLYDVKELLKAIFKRLDDKTPAIAKEIIEKLCVKSRSIW